MQKNTVIDTTNHVKDSPDLKTTTIVKKTIKIVSVGNIIKDVKTIKDVYKND